MLQAVDILQILIEEAGNKNQLVEACKLYLSSELFITELEALAFFNHHVTFPFLNCIEQSTVSELVIILPQLRADLLKSKKSTLSEFTVAINKIPVPVFSSDLAKEIVDRNCSSSNPIAMW